MTPFSPSLSLGPNVKAVPLSQVFRIVEGGPREEEFGERCYHLVVISLLQLASQSQTDATPDGSADEVTRCLDEAHFRPWP